MKIEVYARKRRYATAYLGMRLAGLRVEPFSDNLAVLDDDAANHGVGRGTPDGCPRQFDAPSDVECVVFRRAAYTYHRAHTALTKSESARTDLEATAGRIESKIASCEREIRRREEDGVRHYRFEDNESG